MKFTLAWLRDHLETEAPLDAILAALTDMGLEVEGVEDKAARLGAFRVGYVVEAVPHPDADRLRLCRVETAQGMRQVVCGAPNARAGIKVAVAMPGDHIPGTGITLSVGTIRGVESQAMLCSERELELSDEHSGIMELPADAPVGAWLVDVLGLSDPVVEIKITPNRPDALGVAGIARDLAARGLGRLVTRSPVPVRGAYRAPFTVSLAAEVATGPCPHFLARHIRGVRNGPSPKWLQDRLRAIGLRPISALVDITNYLTFDRGRPLHVFDADRVEAALVVRAARAGETLHALDTRSYTFAGGETVIADAGGIESIGGVMGGLASGCTETTVNVIVESAWFDPIRTAATGRQLRVNSDARYRFERGVDPAFTAPGLELGTRMILDLCGGEASEVVEAGAAPLPGRRLSLRAGRVRQLVGLEIAVDEQVRILTALGFSVAPGEPMEVTVPSWRPDVLGEADLVEEVARIASLANLRGQPLPRPDPGVIRPALTAGQRREGLVRRSLAALGAHECVTYSFIPGPAARRFGGGAEAVRVENPISSEMTHLRPSLLPGLLAAAARNQARGFAELALFELGPVFQGGEPGEQAQEACLLRTGASGPRNPHAPRRATDAFDARADAEAALSAAGVAVDRLMAVRDGLPDWMHPGRAAFLSLGPRTPLALFGELHPRILDAFDVKGPAVAMTLFLGAIPFPRARSITRPALSVSDLPAVERDFAFVVDARVEAETVLKAARGADKGLVERAQVFDVFEGPRATEQLGAGRKSLAVTVRLQPRSATLTEGEIEAVAARIVAAVTKATGGTLRG